MDTKHLIVHGGLNNLRATAAAYFVAQDQDKVSTIIFSGGKTRGKNAPSEAETMKEIFTRKLTYIMGKNTTLPSIILEDASCDTEENVANISKLIKDTTIELTILSSRSHLYRIGGTYKRAGFHHIDMISAEEILLNTKQEKLKRYIDRLRISPKWITAAILEVPLNILSLSESGRELIRKQTSKRIET